jgi:hypothetical protein
MQILNAFVPLEIRRRRWLIRRLVNRMDNMSTKEGAEWLSKNEQKITRVVENLLELSSYAVLFPTYPLHTHQWFVCRESYKPDYRTTAITQGTIIKVFIIASMYELSLEAQTSLSSIPSLCESQYLTIPP